MAETALGQAAVDAEAEWLAAGKRGDVERLRELRLQFPSRLALDRVFHHDHEDGASDAQRPPRARPSDWSGFPLGSLGDSAIHAAAWSGSLAVMRFLLEQGQSPDARDDWQMTPIMVTTMRHALPLYRRVFRGREAVQRHLAVDCREETAARVATTLAIVDLLLAFGADLEARSYDGRTALLTAAHDDAFEIAERLLDAGADIDAQDEKGWTALRFSIESKSLFTTNLLLERGADIDRHDHQGVSPLTAAIQGRFLTQLELIINHYALVSRPSRLDFVNAVLLQAVDLDAFEVVEFLLKDCAFASVDFQNEAGETAFHLVKSRRVVGLLAQYDVLWTAFRSSNALGDSCVHYAARRPGEQGSHVLQALLDVLVRVRNDEAALVQEADAAWNLLGGNAKAATPLYQAATHPSDSLTDRAAKCDQLVALDAPLFTDDARLWRVVDASPHRPQSVLMAAPVRLFLRRWLGHSDLDRVATAGDDVAPGGLDMLALSSHWAGCVALSPREPDQRTDALTQRLRRGELTGELLSAALYAGYARDVVPLLVEMPLWLAQAHSFVDALERFLESQPSAQVAVPRRLVAELRAGLVSIV